MPKRAPRAPFLVLSALLLAPAPRSSALTAPRKIVDYNIQVELSPKEKLFTGNEILRWTNPSSERVGDLRFHLYWNAFRNDRSTFFKESGGRLRGDDADKDKGWGYIDVTSMSWDGKDLKPGLKFESPDDGNPDDRTVLSVALPRPVEPGETVELKIGWKAKAPRVFARAGYVRDFFMVGQWFPKIGVYEPAGMRRRPVSGWNCHQYHANSEFYADFGDYRVAITVPEAFVVGSAGALVSETKAGGKKTLVFEQRSIHDFAWTADPRYVVKEDVFDPAKDLPPDEVARAAKLLGRTEAQLREGFHPVKLRFYMQPDHVDQWTRYADAQKWALAWFGLYAFPYPYAQVSCIDPPEDGSGASGMEYQTLYTAGTWKALGRWPLDRVRFQEMVVIHEFGHGYWYGLLASNEFEESWMDEGINSFTEYEMMDRRYGSFIELPLGFRLPDEETGRVATIASRGIDPIIRKSWQYGGTYGLNSYQRPATVVNQLRRVMGEEAFWRAFRAYAERWRYDHPTSGDFFDALQAGTDRDLRPLVQATFYGTATVDYEVVSAVSRRREPFKGFDDRGNEVGFGNDSKKAEAKKAKGADREPYDSRVVIGRTGGIVLPVDVVLTFENGKSWRTTWDGKSGWLRLRTIYPSRLVKAEVDPDRRVVLDRDPWDNARYLEGWKGASAGRKASAYGLHMVQIILSTLWGLV